MENAWNLVTLANTASSKLQASIKCYSIVFYICAYILIGSFLEIEALHLKKKTSDNIAEASAHPYCAYCKYKTDIYLHHGAVDVWFPTNTVKRCVLPLHTSVLRHWYMVSVRHFTVLQHTT